MASNVSSWYSISGHSSRKYRAYVNAYVQSETDTTATIYVEGCCQAYYMSSYGCRVRVYINGTQVDTSTAAIMNSSGTAGNWAWASGTLTISKSSSSKSITCMCTVSGETVSGCGGVNGGSPSASVAIPVSAITYYAPNAPSDLTNTRESDNKNALAWTAPTTSTTKPVSAILLERSTDGGAWSQIASVSGSATSYNDTTTSADNYYQYRIRAQNVAGYSDYVTSEITHNTPAPPVKVTPSRLAETSVLVSITNSSITATALDLQRSSDGETWVDALTVSGSPVTETTDEPGGGTFYYRARNTRGELTSAWSPVSEAVVTICPPNPPTLISPASGVVVNKAQDQITFVWKHNPIDGSAQTEAEIDYSTDGGTNYTTVSVSGSAGEHSIDNGFSVNDTVTYRIRTKGVDANFGEWSATRVFYVYQQPNVAFAQPTDGFVVENTPIMITLQYEDPSGTIANAQVSISDGQKVVWSRSLGTTLEYEITSDEWVPDNGVTYYASATVRSSSSLTASATRDFDVSFVLPMAASAAVEPDADTGFVVLSLFVNEDAELEPVASINVFREVNGARVLIASGLQPGAGVVDRYAPVNVPYQYVVVSEADSGAINSTYVDALLDTQWFYFVWGDSVARGRINPTASKKIARPNKRRRHFAGRPLPVSFDDGSIDEERTVTLTLRTKEEAEVFDKMIAESGRCVYKSGDGDVIHADVSVSHKLALMQPTYYGSVSVSVHRIDGRAL